MSIIKNELEIALNGCQQIKVHQTKASNVWHLKSPLIPWKHKGIQLERNRLLSIAVREFPICALWLPEENIRLVSKVQGATDSNGDKLAHWSFVDASNVALITESLYEGGWGLFFFSGEKAPALQDIERLQTDSKALSDLLGFLGARAGIVSWYDDNEWLLALSK